MFDNTIGISVKPLAGDEGHLNTHSCTHTSKDVTSTEGRQNVEDSIFSFGKAKLTCFGHASKDYG